MPVVTIDPQHMMMLVCISDGMSIRDMSPVIGISSSSTIYTRVQELVGWKLVEEFGKGRSMERRLTLLGKSTLQLNTKGEPNVRDDLTGSIR